jgi:hypothetical protein
MREVHALSRRHVNHVELLTYVSRGGCPRDAAHMAELGLSPGYNVDIRDIAEVELAKHHHGDGADPADAAGHNDVTLDKMMKEYHSEEPSRGLNTICADHATSWHIRQAARVR